MADRKMPVRLEKVELDGDYDGWWFDCRVSISAGKFVDAVIALESADEKDAAGAMGKLFDLVELLVKDWNYVDEDGADIPCNKDGFRQLPFDLLTITCRKAREVVERVPLASSSE